MRPRKGSCLNERLEDPTGNLRGQTIVSVKGIVMGNRQVEEEPNMPIRIMIWIIEMPLDRLMRTPNFGDVCLDNLARLLIRFGLAQPDQGWLATLAQPTQRRVKFPPNLLPGTK